MKHGLASFAALLWVGVAASACTSSASPDAITAQQPGVVEYPSSRLPGMVKERGVDCYRAPSPGCSRHGPAY